MKIILRLSSIFFLLLLLSFFPVSAHADDLTKSWNVTTSLPYSLASHVAFGNGKKAFVLDGSAQTGNSHNQIISAISGVSGGLSNWSVEASFPTALIFHAIARKDNNIYILGGREENPGSAMDHVSKVFVANMNSLGSWGQTFPLPSNRSLGAAAISGDYIYFSGGFNTTGYTNKVYASHIKPDGMLDPWFEVSALPLTRIGHGMIEDNGSLYVLGGDNANQVYRATVNTSNGTISSWSQISTLPEKLYRSAVIKIGNQIYMIGGHNGTSTINKIYFTTINSDGSLGSWQLSANTLPLPVQGGAVAQAGKYLYLTGGFRSPPGTYLNSVYKTELNISIEPDLNVPLFKQTDPAWGSQVYDSANIWQPNNPGIDASGCALTSAAMVFNYHKITKLPDGSSLDPKSLNIWLKNNNGYVGGAVSWVRLSALSEFAKSQNSAFTFDSLKYFRVNEFNGEQLLNDLEQGIPGILEVPGHFIVGKGVQNGKFLINDPFYNRTSLSDYGDTFLSLGRFVPTNSDVSYIELAVDEGAILSVKNQNGEVVGEGFLQEPYSVDGHPSSNVARYFYLVPVPDNEEHTIIVSAGETKEYTLIIRLQGEDGEFTEKTVKGIVDSGSHDIFSFNFSKSGNNKSDIQQELSFDSIISDLELLYNLGEISNIGIYITLRQNISVSQQLLSVSKAASTAHLKNVLSILKSQRKKFVSETAYKILYPQVQQLLSTI